MAVEGKYGQITTERGSIPADEPVFLLRAQDITSVDTIEAYLSFCERAGSPLEHREAVMEAAGRFLAWQADNRDKVKVPGKARS